MSFTDEDTLFTFHETSYEGIGGINLVVKRAHWVHSLYQQQKDSAAKNQILPFEQSKCKKLAIDTNIQLTLYKDLHFTEGP